MIATATWDQSQGADSYRLYSYSVPGGATNQLYAGPKCCFAFDLPPAPVTRYFFVTAVNSVGASDPSKVAIYQTLSVTPTARGFQVKYIPVVGKINVVERSDDLVKWSPVKSTTKSGVASYTDRGTAGCSFFRVRLQ